MTRTDFTLFRVDKFVVPAAARDAFLDAVRASHQTIGAQPGCLQNHVLEQIGGPGEFNFVSIVQWSSAEDMEKARQVMSELHVRTGIDIQAFRKSKGIHADVGYYQQAPGMTSLLAA